jgi:ribosomal protein S18 acetylase RimI-like enzyme
MEISVATERDAEEILELQKIAFQSEAARYNDWSIAPLTQSVDELRDELAHSTVLKMSHDGRIVGSVRGSVCDGVCSIRRLIVHPDYRRRGIGSRLMAAIESAFPEASRFELFTGSESEGNIRLYTRLGYAVSRTQSLSPSVTVVFLEKLRPPAGTSRSTNRGVHG